MANTTATTTTRANTMTQAQALRYLIDHAPAETPSEVLASAEKLYTAKTKVYARPTGAKSKERKANEALVPALISLIKDNPGELINATFINNNLDNVAVRSPQKARVIADIAIEQGLLEKFNHKGRVYYCLPGACPISE